MRLEIQCGSIFHLKCGVSPVLTRTLQSYFLAVLGHLSSQPQSPVFVSFVLICLELTWNIEHRPTPGARGLKLLLLDFDDQLFIINEIKIVTPMIRSIYQGAQS